MRIPNAKSFNRNRHSSPLIGLLFVSLLLSPARVRAPEDPPGCDYFPEDYGYAFYGGISFNLTQAHLGDTVPVFPWLSNGPVGAACKATNVAGTVWIATGRLTNFLLNATLDPEVLVSCPSNVLCQPGPYNVLITPELVGAVVRSPNGSLQGIAKTVRVVENASGVVLNYLTQEIWEFHTATISIVTPCIEVVQMSSYPCFARVLPVPFTGYVTNCGDIRLTNVMVVNSRSALLRTTNGMLFPQSLTLDPGQAVGFQGSFQPTAQDNSAGSATNEITATARDTTTIGGPNAFVTNSTAFSWAICRDDPPGCACCPESYGYGIQGGINFNLSQAHIGDTVQLFPTLGNAYGFGVCRAVNAIGSVWLATGRLTNFLINVNLDLGVLIFCPSNGLCQPGPYNVLITPALVGAGVSTPNGTVPGVAKKVRAVENGEGLLLTGDPRDMIYDFHTATISIVTPCIRVVERCAYPAGTSCFPADAPVQFTGYVTNCGDIALTNVTVMDDRTGQLTLFNPTNGSALSGNTILSPGAFAVFSNSFQPTLQESSTGSATNVLTATARDTTAIGGPNAAVTNSTTGSCAICLNPHLAAPTYTPDGQFQFNVAGRAGSNYVVQVSTNLSTPNWLSLLTNAAPFTFVESNAALYPLRFYRAMLPP